MISHNREKVVPELRSDFESSSKFSLTNSNINHNLSLTDAGSSRTYIMNSQADDTGITDIDSEPIDSGLLDSELIDSEQIFDPLLFEVSNPRETHPRELATREFVTTEVTPPQNDLRSILSGNKKKKVIEPISNTLIEDIESNNVATVLQNFPAIKGTNDGMDVQQNTPIIKESEDTSRLDLRSILNGNMKRKNPEIPIQIEQTEFPNFDVLRNLDDNNDIVIDNQKEFVDETDSEISDNLDSSFTETKSNQYKREYDVMELEKKIYKQNIKAVSAKDLFSRLKKKQEEVPDDVVEILTDPIVIEDDLEAKMYGENVKRTTARDLFKSLKPLAKKKKEPESKHVTLKVDRANLAEIKKYDNPLKTKGNSTGNSTGTSTNFFSRVTTYPVTLKIDPSKLSEIKKFENPFKTKGNDFFVGNNSTTSTDFFKQKPHNPKSLFDSLMNASKNSVKLTPLQKLKELYPPSLTREQFHVKYDDNQSCFLENFPSISLPTKSPLEVNIDHISEDKSVLFLAGTPLNSPTPYIVTIKDDCNIESLVDTLIPNLTNIPQLHSLYQRFFREPIELKKDELWIHLFQPETMNDLLMSYENILSINNWIKNSFKRLKAQSLKNPRKVLIRQQKKRKQKKSLNGFVVDDSYGNYFEDSDTEEDIFVPLLILQGSVGSCKSSAIYSAMREINGYVHEINTGLDRGRKDIYNSLKEFCTTQIVHKNNKKTFQQGIVLLEEVNILFEQDKSFWLAVQDILNVSRRPVVLTCENLLNIPKSLLEFTIDDNSIVKIDDNIILEELLIQYLWLASLSQGFDVEISIIQRFVKSSFNGHNYDIRKCLMECQLLCQPYIAKRQGKAGIVSISQNIPSNSKSSMDLATLAENLDILSCSDVLTTNSISLINHSEQMNELVDIDWLDESTLLTQPRLPYELEIGQYLTNCLKIDERSIPQDASSLRSNLKDIAVDYIGSRSKKLPKFIQELQSARRSTRSFTSTPQPEEDSRAASVEALTANWSLEITGVPETSFLNHLNPLPLVTELLPHCRQWARFQNALDKIESTTIENGGESIKRFLNFRDFQQDLTKILETLPL